MKIQKIKDPKFNGYDVTGNTSPVTIRVYWKQVYRSIRRY